MRTVEKKRKLPIELKSSIAYVICNVLQKGAIVLTMPLFTRLLTTEQYGQVTLYTSWSAVVSVLITLNLAYGSFSKAMIKFENRRDEYASSVQGLCLCISSLFLVIYLPFNGFWTKIFKLPALFIILMVAELLFQNSILMWCGKKRFEYKYKSVVAVTLAQMALSIAWALILLLYIEEKGYARIFGFATATAILGMILFIANWVKGKKFFSRELWKYALGFNIPLVPYYLSQVIFNQSDRIMISHLKGESHSAIYDVAYNIAMVMTVILNAIENAYEPWLYNKIKNERQGENKPISTVISISMSLMLLCVIWYAPELVYLFGGEKYTEAVWVVAPVAASVLLLFYTHLFVDVEFYYEEKGMLVWASLGAAVINIVLNAWLIPIYGFVAAGYTTFASYIVFAVANLFAMKRTLKHNMAQDDMFDYRALLIVFVCFTASTVLGVVLYDSLPIRIAITISVLLVLVIKRKTFIDCFRSLKG